MLKAEIAIVLNTSDTTPDRELTVFGDPLETLWKICIFQYCGIKKFVRKTYGVIITSNLAQREKWLNDVEKVVNEHFPLMPQRHKKPQLRENTELLERNKGKLLNSREKLNKKPFQGNN